MALLFFLLGFIIGIYLFFDSENKSKKQNICKMHKWQYNNEGAYEEYMSCSVCGCRPGQDTDDGSQL